MLSETDSNNTNDGDDEGSSSSQSSPGRSSSDNNFSEDEGEDEDHSLGLSSGPGRINSDSDNNFLGEDDDSSDSGEDESSDQRSTSSNDSDSDVGDISDDEDKEIFGTSYMFRKFYHCNLRSLKHQAPDCNDLILRRDLDMTPEMWKRIGHFLGTNKRIERLTLASCSLTTDTIRALVNGGLKDNKSIQYLDLASNFDLGKSYNMHVLTCFLTNILNNHESQLFHLNLSQVGFDAEGLTILFSALDGNRTLTNLNLSANVFSSKSDEGKAFEALLPTIQLQNLKELILRHCTLSKCGIVAIAKFLENKNISPDMTPPKLMHHLCMSHNNLDDECSSILAGTLKKHPILERLDISYNETSEKTFDYFVDALCDSSTINSIYASNHTLKWLSPRKGDPLARLRWNEQDDALTTLMNINKNSQSPNDAASQKVLLYYFTDKNNFGVSYFDETTIEVMPTVLHWTHSKHGLPGLYSYMRHWKVPSLYSFPSAESLRLGEKMESMRGEIRGLESENSALKLENGKLFDENAALKEIIEKQKAQLAKLQHSRSDTTEKSNDMLSPSSKKMKI